MNSPHRCSRALRMGLTIACAAGLPAVAQTGRSSTSASSFESDLKALAAGPHRLAGHEDGSRAASRYVQQRLAAMGIREIAVQEFPVIQPEMTECRIEAGGETYPMFAMRPNLLQASVTPAGGITGDTLYVGRGAPEDYGTATAENRIVVLDFDCGHNWRYAFAFGARAVLFVGAGEAAANAWHHVNIPANLPRFYIPAELAEELQLRTETRSVTLYAACRWRDLRGRNVIATLRGTGADGDRPVEALLLAAPLDSYSEVPTRGPGARDAANCAALLECARYLSVNRPRRDIIFCFFDAQALQHAGARAFYGALYRRAGAVKLAEHTLAERRRMLEEEREYVRRLEQIIRRPDPFVPEVRGMPSYAGAMRRLRSEARMISVECLDKVRLLRLDRLAVQRELLVARKAGSDDEVVDLTSAIREFDRGVAAAAREDLGWNRIQKDLHEEHISEGGQTRLTQLLERTREWCRRRLGELDDQISRAETAATLRESIGADRCTVVLHVSLNLGDARKRWTLLHGEDSISAEQDVPGHYTGIFKTVRGIHDRMGSAAPNFDARAVSGLYPNRLFAPSLRAESGAIARIFGCLNVSFTTVLDPLSRQGQPADTLESLNAGHVWNQVREVAPFVKAMADHPDLGVPSPLRATARFTESGWLAGRIRGPVVRQVGAGSGMRAPPVRGAVVAVVPQFWTYPNWWEARPEDIPPGFEHAIRVRTDTHGIFEVPPHWPRSGKVVLAATFDDAQSGDAGSAWRSRGLIAGVTCMSSINPQGDLARSTIELCRVQGFTAVGYGTDRGIRDTTGMRAVSSAQFNPKRHLLCESGNVLALFAPYDVPRMKLFNKDGVVLLNNTRTREHYQGQGLPLADRFQHPESPRWTAHDLRTLNEYRLTLLRENRINQDSLEVLNGTAADLEEDALADRDASSAWRYGTLEASAAFSRRVYRPLTTVMRDLVAAVVWLLLLAIPFAYSLERLLIGTPHVYRQIAWFCLFFVITFIALYAVNPAFRLAATPVIIFLAFTIILLSALVVYIMARKLQSEIRKMQGLSASVHQDDVSRLTTMAAAVKMGISTMRRRPMRTLLVTLTVILLTFTILTFASFSNQWGTRRTYIGPLRSPPARVLVRHPLWRSIGQGVTDALRGALGHEARVVPRYWVSSEVVRDPLVMKAMQPHNRQMLVTDAGVQKVVPVAAAMGLDLEDTLRQQAIQEVFSPDARVDLLARDGLFVTRAVQEALGFEEKDVGKARVMVAGLEMTYAGTVSDRFAELRYLEGTSVLPVDYELTIGESGSSFKQQLTEDLSEGAAIESAQFIAFNLDRVVIVSPRMARRMGGRVRSLCIYPDDPGRARELASHVATVTGLPVFAGDREGVSRFYFMSLISARGWRELLIPVLLGSLIVFATMLGSITDREREIYTFSALGLAPPHVAGLFFAEAAIYAVLGGMGGYLLGQGVARGLGWIGSHFLISVPALNYSSTNVIATILIVMATILVSTVYPAVRASRSANPGIQRSWRIPEPVGDMHDVLFPFTVSAYDFTGVVNFLKEHFDNHVDTSLGLFATTGCHVFRQEGNDMLGLRGAVALAPFDLGIEQSFVLLSRPSDVEGVDEVRVVFQRTDGSPRDWRRANRVFIDDLRRQFLLWRSLTPEIMETYRERTIAAWAELPTEAAE